MTITVTPSLHLAARAGETGRIRELIVNGTDVNQLGNDGETALWWAVREGKRESVHALLAEGCPVTQDLLVVAVATEHFDLEIIKTLLAMGLDSAKTQIEDQNLIDYVYDLWFETKDDDHHALYELLKENEESTRPLAELFSVMDALLLFSQRV